MGEAKTIIRIDDKYASSRVPCYINGVGRDLYSDRDEPVNDDQLKMLTDSNVKFEIVGGAKPKATGREEEGAPASRPDEAAPGDDAFENELQSTRNANVAHDTGGTDGLIDASTGQRVNETLEERAAVADANQAETDAKAAARELVDDMKAAGADADANMLNGKPFVAEDVLSGNIGTISEDLDEFSPAQLKALIDAENAKGDKARVTLIAALEKKLG
jgi:hypothetical protein